MLSRVINNNRLALPKSQYQSVFNGRPIVYMSKSGYTPIINVRANMSYNQYIDEQRYDNDHGNQNDTDKERDQRQLNILTVVLICGLTGFNYYFDNYTTFKKELMLEMKEIKNEITAKTSPRFVRCVHCNGTVEANPFILQETTNKDNEPKDNH